MTEMSKIKFIDRPRLIPEDERKARRGEVSASSMTIREAFAMAALQGLLARGTALDKPKIAVNMADELLVKLAE